MPSTYPVTADLSDHADFDGFDIETNEYGFVTTPDTRTALLRQTIPSVDTIHSERVGSWSGTESFGFEVDGLLWLIRDHYGSCSHCDGFIAADSRDDYVQYARTLMSNAYAFDDRVDAHRFVDEQAEDALYGWNAVQEEAHEIIDTVEF
jgi:hypothetical protein